MINNNNNNNNEIRNTYNINIIKETINNINNEINKENNKNKTLFELE